MKASQWAEGRTLDCLVTVEGRSILFIGSANFIEDAVQGLRPDLAAIGIGMRQKIPDYSCRLMRALEEPRLVLANHFDAHRKPLAPDQFDQRDQAVADRCLC